MKKIKYLLFIILITFIGTLRVNAFSVTGATTTTVGSSIAVTIEASGLTGRFDVTTTNGSVLSGGKSIWLENNSTTLYFTAQSVGTANVVVTATNVSDENGNDFTGKRILYVTVKEKSSSSNNNKKPSVDVNKKYSSNNYLKSLSIEGYELEPVFNKETLEYNVTLKVDTTSINVLAEKEDSTATVNGIGQVPVNDGPNTVIVTVVAENGNERQYKINATVEEPEPIEVTINNKKYTIARKNKLENVPTGFEEKLINIEGQNVNAYYNEIAKITIVSLKDEKGNISLFSYNNGKYTPFNEAKTAGVNLSILSNEKKAPTGFIKTIFKYNDVTLNGYKLKGTKNDNYYLVYAQSLETGDKAFYLYDKKEGTFQRYYEELSNVKDTQIEYLFYIATGLLGLFIVIILIKIINKLFTSKERKIKKYQKKIDKLNKKINSNYTDDSNGYDIDDVDERPVIKQVEEDEYVVPKKTRKQTIKEIEQTKKKLDKTKPSFRRVSLEDDD